MSCWARLGLGAVGLGWAALRRRPITPWLLVLGWIALFAAGYTALRVAFYGWYAIPLALGWAVLLAWGITTAGQVAGAISGVGMGAGARQTGAASGTRRAERRPACRPVES